MLKCTDCGAHYAEQHAKYENGKHTCIGCGATMVPVAEKNVTKAIRKQANQIEKPWKAKMPCTTCRDDGGACPPNCDARLKPTLNLSNNHICTPSNRCAFCK